MSESVAFKIFDSFPAGMLLLIRILGERDQFVDDRKKLLVRFVNFFHA